MISGGAQSDLHAGAAGSATLDGLFRRAALRDVDGLALADAPNRESFTDGASRRLTYAQADRAISAMAGTLRRLGLQTDTVVATQLPNTVESVIVLLGIWRAGMIAAPLPLLWRKHDIVDALKPLAVKAIVTASRIGSARAAEIAMQAAAELFPVRYVCGFGRDLPDGVVSLDGIFAPGTPDFDLPQTRLGNAAGHIATVTFHDSSGGVRAAARGQRELIAGGLGPYLESGAPLDEEILSAIPLGSFAGLSVTLLPWLLGGGTLNLHHAFDADVFAAQARALNGGSIVVPGPALAALTAADSLGAPARVVALWRSPERLAAAFIWRGDAALVDVASFGEVGLIASRRDGDSYPASIPAGLVGAPRGASGAVALCETQRSVKGMLLMRGALVPGQAFPPGAEDGCEPHLDIGQAGFVDTGWPCRLDSDGRSFSVTAPPAGMIGVGGYRFAQAAIDKAVISADPGAMIVALPDAVLGLRLAGACADPAAMIASLDAGGFNGLLARAFQPRRLPDAA